MTSPGLPHPDELVALAVARAYRAFARHRLGSSMTVRRPDVTVEDVLALAVPRREVTAAAIDRWLPHAATTWGTAGDLKALLPRVLELFVAGRLASTPEVLFGKLHQVGLGEWPLEERAAVDDVVSALWVATLTAHPAPTSYPAWRLLAALAELGDPLTPFLEDWDLLRQRADALGEAARRHLADLAERAQRAAGRSGGLHSLFWSPHPVEGDRLRRWLGASRPPPD
jgi:hypothetical protein